MKFITQYKSEIYSERDIEAVISRIDLICRAVKQKPVKQWEKDGMNSLDYSREQVRKSLKLYGQLRVRLTDRSIIYIQQQKSSESQQPQATGNIVDNS